MKKLLAILCILCLSAAAILPVSAEEMVGMANPWVECTKEELLANPGFPFALPEGATDVRYSVIEDELLAQIDLKLESTDICYRMKAASEWTDISGLYYSWENEEEDYIGWCKASLKQTHDGENTMELLQWYDAAPGIMYSISAVAPDLDGFDLKAVALQMYVPAQDEANGFEWSELDGIIFEFSSGAGGWNTELRINWNGSFTGVFHDSEMGESGEDYPNGTVYGCTFHGKFTKEPMQLDLYTWQATVEELELDEGQVSEAIQDGIRYVTTDPYGIALGHSFTIYTPGIDREQVPEACMSWLHLEDVNSTVLPCYALYDVAEETAFAGWIDSRLN